MTQNISTKMRYLAFILIFSVIVSCKKKEIQLTNGGEITGISICDYACIAACPCNCGSYIFHFTDTGDSTNVVIDNRGIFNLPSNTQFPAHVTVDWQNTTRCGVKAIKILNYKLF
jgi:hypothetical protein